MTLSKKQRLIIWGSVIIIVLILGLVSSESRLSVPNYNNRISVFIETHLYGIRIDRRWSREVSLLSNGREYIRPASDADRIAEEILSRHRILANFFSALAKNKAGAVFAVIIIGLALFLTVRKK